MTRDVFHFILTSLFISWRYGLALHESRTLLVCEQFKLHEWTRPRAKQYIQILYNVLKSNHSIEMPSEARVLQKDCRCCWYHQFIESISTLNMHANVWLDQLVHAQLRTQATQLIGWPFTELYIDL